MILANKNSDTELMALVSSIKNHMSEWQIVNIKMLEKSQLTQKQVLEKFLAQYKMYDGLIYPVSPQKIVMLARLGLIDNYSLMKAEIEKNIPHHSCRIMLRKMSAIGLKQIQIDLTSQSQSVDLVDKMFHERSSRKENILMIADDDAFVRKTMSTLLIPFGETIQVASANDVLRSYLEHNPDILLLDIHMPEKSGLEIIPSIMEVDPDAYIIVLSADSQKDNVLKALELGAAGFLSKPAAKERVQEYLNQCITIR